MNGILHVFVEYLKEHLNTNTSDNWIKPIKTRLCIRGDLENGKDNLRSDSLTAGKDSLKIALMMGYQKL